MNYFDKFESDESKIVIDADEPDNLQSQRREEFESLKVIYKDDDIEFKSWNDRLGFKLRFKENGAMLEIVTTSKYPSEPPSNISLYGIGISHTVRIMNALDTTAKNNKGSVMLFDLIEETRSLLFEKNSDKNELEPAPQQEVPYYTHHSWADAEYYMAGVTIPMIANRLKESDVTILHAELVMNPHLVDRFEEMYEFLSQKYQKHPGRRDYLSKEVVFHGTRREFIPNIIARGFIKPGDAMNSNGDILQVRIGSTFGRGIYTSPEPRYSMSYSDYTDFSSQRIPGQKIIVCAVLMGCRYTCPPGRFMASGEPNKGYDSHVSPSKYEYVIFNSAQLLPLIVLHVTNGIANHESIWKQRFLQGPPIKLNEGYDVLSEMRKSSIAEIYTSETILTVGMQRRIMTKIARKHFPFGFGPAEGDRFIVEEIGAVDDDEEEWGEYQLDRGHYMRDCVGILHDADYYKPRDEFQKPRFVN